MSRYLLPRVPGASVCFTVALVDRSRNTLVAHIDSLRAAVRPTRAEHPIRIDAWVVLPEQQHCVWTLPEGEADYSVRWRVITSRFSRGVPVGPVRPSHAAR